MYLFQDKKISKDAIKSIFLSLTQQLLLIVNALKISDFSLYPSILSSALSTRAVEYADCTSAEK